MDDQQIRAEFEKLHERVSNMKERVVNLEAQQPHTTNSLVRIEKSIERLNAHLVKAVWAVIAVFIAGVGQFIIRGGLTPPGLH